MAVAHEPWVLWFSCILSDSAVHCSIRRGRRWWLLVRPGDQRGRFFSIPMMQDSAGAGDWRAAGQLAAAVIFAWCAAPAPRCFIACAAFNAWYLPSMEALGTVKTPIREGLGRVLRDKRFVTYVLTLDRLLYAGGAGDADAADHGE